MTHYNVAVISDGTKTFQQLIEPYDEENEDYFEFIDDTDSAKDEWENGTYTLVRDPEYGLVFGTSEIYRVPGTYGYCFSKSDSSKKTHRGPENHKEV